MFDLTVTRDGGQQGGDESSVLKTLTSMDEPTCRLTAVAA